MLENIIKFQRYCVVVLAAMLFGVAPSLAYDLPVRYIKDSAWYLVRVCSVKESRCENKVTLQFRGIKLATGTIFYIDTYDNNVDNRVFQILILDGEENFLSKCSVYFERHKIVNNECVNGDINYRKRIGYGG